MISHKPRAKSIPPRKNHKPYVVQYHIGFLIHEVSRIRRAVFDRALKPLGITRSQWWLLVNLSQISSDGASQRQLASLMRMSEVSIGELLPSLAESKLILRQSDTRDRRKRMLSLTDAGYDVLDLSRKIAAAINEEILRGIPKKDIETTERTMRSIRLNLSALDVQRDPA